MKVFSASFTLNTGDSSEVSDITKLVRDAIEPFPVASGISDELGDV